MPIAEIGTFLMLLVIVFIVGNLWFHFVESILRQINKLFTRHSKSSAWHPLSPGKENVRHKKDYKTGTINKRNRHLLL